MLPFGYSLSQVWRAHCDRMTTSHTFHFIVSRARSIALGVNLITPVLGKASLYQFLLAFASHRQSFIVT